MTALDLLRDSLTEAGYLASPTERTNYRRVWARDGVICGLAGLVSGDDALADGLRRTVETLLAHVGPQGQVPSNVSVVDGATEAVSYGGLAGRVDAGPWAVLGAARWAAHAGDAAWAARWAPAVGGVLDLLDAWEVNARGLVYVPQSGDWADEYDLHGYLLYDQVLRLLALRAWAPWAPSPASVAVRADRVHAVVEATFWPHADGDPEVAYHPAAYRAAQSDPAPYPFAALTPGGYARRFDALGSALAVLAGLWPDRRDAVLDHGLALAEATEPGLVPAFAPQIREGDGGWATLRANTRDRFSNRPGHYHNGGCWPMVNGWWVAALAEAGRAREAEALRARVEAANADVFPEYLDADEGARLGTAPLAWSAAGAVLGAAALAGRLGDWTPALEPGAAPDDAAAVDVVVAGEVLADLITTEPTDDLGGAVAFERHAGGSPANLASNLARLGVSVAFVASVGDDGLGRFLEAAAERVGVDARFAVRDEPTSLVAVARSAGTPDFAAYRAADRLLWPSQLADALLRRARLFHTSGFALSREPARATLLDAAARAHALGLAVSIDVNFAPDTAARRAEQDAAARQILSLGPLVKCSRDDLARLWGRDPASDDAAVARLLGLGASLVCLTRGSDGALVAWDGGVAEVPAEPVEAADVTGAGDAFWAGFLAAWLAGQDPPACARAGARMAARKLAHVGPLPDAVDPAAVLGTG